MSRAKEQAASKRKKLQGRNISITAVWKRWNPNRKEAVFMTYLHNIVLAFYEWWKHLLFFDTITYY
ncbi:hypothetical protein [Paenibacillus terrae]|uniref:hypothetical protein n=1 Tax=Paenibacillus terrae TaxID=159743 RepID=UPI0010BECA47|nr:hypothetical protein [Paenibacillus terrae]